MSNREFEKQVQQKMEELRFEPSEPVWIEVEKQIRKRKDRRRMLIWFFFGALLLGGAGVWFYGNNKSMHNTIAVEKKNSNSADKSNTTTIENNSTNPEQTSQPSSTGNSTQKESVIATNDENNESTDKATSSEVKGSEKNKQAVVGKLKPVGSNEASQSIDKENISTDKKAAISIASVSKNQKINKGTGSERNRGDKVLPKRKNNTAPKTAVEIVDEKINVANKKQPDARKENTTDEVIGKEDVDVVAGKSKDIVIIQQQKQNDSANSVAASQDGNENKPSVKEDSAITVVSETKKTDSSLAVAANKKAKQSAKKKWEYGFSVHGGFSNISEGIGAIFTPAYADNLYASPNVSGIGNGVGLITLPPSDVKGGASFGLGVDVRKQFGKRWWFTTGIHYSYASTRVKVGTKVDSSTTLYFSSTFSSRSVSNYYQNSYLADAGYNYTNAFHFIQLPVSVEKQLGRKSRFLVNTGVSLSYLLGTSVLHYNNAKNVYFKDRSLVNSFQLNFDAGLSFRVIQQKKISVKIGPQIQYGLTNIFDKTDYGSKHLLSAGIGVQIIFNKK